MRDQAEDNPANAINLMRFDPTYADMSSQEYQLAKEKEQQDAAEAQAQQRRQEEERRQQELELARAAKNQDIFNRLGALSQGIAGASKDSVAAKETVENRFYGDLAFCTVTVRTMEKCRMPTGVPATQADKGQLLQMFRRNIALRAVSELVSIDQEKQT